MSDAFDPYYRWLGIPPKDQPPNHYRLLGLDLFEEVPDVIESAADRQMAHVRTFQTGKHVAAAQRTLNELSAARVCLLNADRKRAYDAQLRSSAAAIESAVDSGSPPELAGKTAAASAIHGAASRPKSYRAVVAGASGVVLLVLIIVFVVLRGRGEQPQADDDSPPGKRRPARGNATAKRAAKNTVRPAFRGPLKPAGKAPIKPLPAGHLTGKLGLRFDGHDYVELKETRKLGNLQVVFTAEVWARMKKQRFRVMGTFMPRGRTAAKASANGWDVSLLQSRNSGRPLVSLRYGGSKAKGGSSLTRAIKHDFDDGWHHIAVTFDPSRTLTVYIDGRPTLKTTWNWGDVAALENLQLGAIRLGPFAATSGEMAGFRLSNTCRFKREFERPTTLEFVPDAETIALLDFSRQNSTLTDLTGNGHDGRITRAQWFSLDQE